MVIEIVRRPDGEQPESIRDAWIGTRLAVQKVKAGYSVLLLDAVEELVLDKKNDAVDWWCKNMPLCDKIIFNPESCKRLD